jgi:hypothetical protein
LHTDTAEQASETVEGGAVVSERVRLRPRSHVVARPLLSRDARRCRRKFLEYFPDGFRDSVYLETERAYKLDAHKRWEAELGPDEFARLYADRDFAEIAARAVRIESRTNLLFSFEKMAVRDAVAQTGGAQVFADGLAEWIYGTGGKQERFDAWLRAVAGLPRRQTRVLTWPVTTVFGFIARPRVHLFLKPTVTRRAADAYGFPFAYSSKPTWPTYASALAFARTVRRDLQDLHPRDMIDIQSFLWVQGSEEYA